MFTIRCDASDTGIGAVLLQWRDGLLRPCAFASRKLLERERRYPIIEREGLAIVFAVKKFQRYLHFSRFIIETDHKPLQCMQAKKTTNSRIMRWALALQQFSFTIRAIPGSENVHADALSRLSSKAFHWRAPLWHVPFRNFEMLYSGLFLFHSRQVRTSLESGLVALMEPGGALDPVNGYVKFKTGMKCNRN